MDNLIRRQWLVECVNEGWIKFDTEKDENRFIHLVRDIAPSAQQEQTTERKKQNIIRMIEDGITATSAKDVYSCGVRNGMRWCKALLDDKEPEYEDAQPETCEELEDGGALYVRLGRWHWL